MEKTVEAVICGHEITSAEVDAFIASLPRRKNKLNKNTPQLINIVFTGILSKIKNR